MVVLLLLNLLLGSIRPAGVRAQANGPNAPADTALARDLGRTDELRARGEYERARRRLLDLREESGAAEVFWRLAHVELELGERAHTEAERLALYESAYDRARRALEADSSHVRAHLARAMAAGRLAQAVDGRERRVELSRAMQRHADRALEIDPESHLAHYLLGRWHFELATMGGITRMAARALYGGLPSASLEEAIRHLEAAIQEDDAIAYRLTLARVHRANDDLQSAADQLSVLLEMSSERPGDPRRKNDARSLLIEVREEIQKEKDRRGWFGISL